jgi:hypothetical protein
MADLSIIFEADYGHGTITNMYGPEGDEVDDPRECISFVAYMHSGEYAGQWIVDDMGDCIAIPITRH